MKQPIPVCNPWTRPQLSAAAAQLPGHLVKPRVQLVCHTRRLCCSHAASTPHEAEGWTRSSQLPSVQSRFKGIYFDHKTSKWTAFLWQRQSKTRMYLGTFHAEEEAARAYDQAAIIHNTPLGGVTEVNFHTEVPPAVQALTKQYKLGSRQKRSSMYKGVAWFAYRHCWQAVVRIDGRLDGIGLFTTEKEAARAVDVHLIKRLGKDKALGRGLNFPVEQYDVQSLLADAAKEGAMSGIEAGGEEQVLSPAKPPRHPPASAFKGVYKGGAVRWRADVYVKGRKYSAGYHDSELEAAIARDRKLLQIKGAATRTTELNFPIRRQEFMEELLKQDAE